MISPPPVTVTLTQPVSYNHPRLINHLPLGPTLSADFICKKPILDLQIVSCIQPTDVKSRLAFTSPCCLAADLEFGSVDFATVEVEFELNRSEVGRK